MAQLTPYQIDQFNRDGFLMQEQIFDAEEMDLLIGIARSDQRLEEQALERRDANANTSKLWLTDALEDDIYSAFVRCLRVVEPLEQLLGGEVYHYHHKMMLKEPFVGGSWEWHQDYGYWYANECLFPYMASCLIAVDQATTDNGCLQVLRGSHLMGRIDHGKSGYSYANECLFPYMASCLIAVDQATTDNGCLQVLRGSHLMGRIDHGKSGD